MCAEHVSFAVGISARHGWIYDDAGLYDLQRSDVAKTLLLVETLMVVFVVL